ncbi:MAG TPA: MBL fold metallo-hydrolase [Gammaproteobacteria bacterium]|nr:MBL fold metallo-hydrolase [Gammaproteobacteria bacterium]
MPIAAGSGYLDRRALLAGAAAVAALGPERLSAQAATVEITRVNDRLSVIGGFGGNVVVLGGPGVILVDGGRASHTQALLETVAGIVDPNRIETLFNTHWHLDQIGSNASIRQLGASLIAHEKTRLRLATPYYLPAEDRYHPAEPPEAQPTMSFFDKGELVVGGETIAYGYLLEAHTDGDIYVKFENDNVIAVGDAIAPSRDPELDWFGGGWLGGRVDSLRLLLDISDSGTQFVPAYGPVVDRAYVEAEHELMLALFDILFERIRAGESAADIDRSRALDALARRFDDPGRLLYDAHKSMWGHYNTLSHDIV